MLWTMRLLRLFYINFMLCVLAGCAAYPTYKKAKDEQIVLIKRYGLGAPFFCKEGKNYFAQKTEDGDIFEIPSGDRITLGAHMEIVDYKVTLSCKPVLSFIPQHGERYVLNLGIQDRRCLIEVARQYDASETGLMPVWGIDAPNCREE